MANRAGRAGFRARHPTPLCVWKCSQSNVGKHEAAQRPARSPPRRGDPPPPLPGPRVPAAGLRRRRHLSVLLSLFGQRVVQVPRLTVGRLQHRRTNLVPRPVLTSRSDGPPPAAPDSLAGPEARGPGAGSRRPAAAHRNGPAGSCPCPGAAAGSSWSRSSWPST